jgi:DNA-binding transcriptional ArsR family regulator
MVQKRVSKDTPLAEITLRKYEKPVNLERRELVKKICLSIGLLQPGDSRDIIVDILYVVLEADKPLSSEEIKDKAIEVRKKYNLQLNGVAPSNVRRQIKRLKDMFLIEKIVNEYRINENDNISNLFKEKILKFYVEPSVERIKEYFELVK